MIEQLGALPLSPDILGKSHIGLWAFELDEDRPPRMYVDDTMLVLLGLADRPAPEDTYHAWYDHIDGGSYGLVAEAVDKMTAGEHAEVQYPWHHPDGTTRMVRCGGVRNPAYTRGVRIEGVHQDVTRMFHFSEYEEHKKLLQENMQIIGGLASEYLALYYVNLADDTFKVYSIDGERLADTRQLLQTGNDAFALLRVFFNSPAVHPDDRELFADMTPEGVAARLAHSKRFTVRFRRDYGAGFLWSEMDVVKYEPKDDPAVAIAIGFAERDKEVRREQEYQAQLQDAMREAEEANRAKTSFLFSMSHDIRTPMNAIVGFTNIAKKSLDDKARLVDALDKTQEASALLLSLVNSILDMSRIESGQIKLEETVGDVHYTFANIESTLQELAHAKDIELRFEVGDVTDSYVYADYERCARIFVNIITNAIKYTPAGGHVLVRCEQAAPASDGRVMYRYTFADDGIGMSEEFQRHVFEEFSREENSTTNGIQGSGLGLAVCKQLVELMGGTISCQSKQGIGTTFVVELPFRIQEDQDHPGHVDPLTGEVVRAGEDLDEGSDGAKACQPLDFAGKRVLLVEDNALNAEIAQDILEDEGMEVDLAEDGSVAVQKMRENGPKAYDFILMDIQMPIMGGYEATRTIRQMYPDVHVPIIALSANAFAEDREASIAAGMDGHVAKPINVSELFGALARFV